MAATGGVIVEGGNYITRDEAEVIVRTLVQEISIEFNRNAQRSAEQALKSENAVGELHVQVQELLGATQQKVAATLGDIADKQTEHGDRVRVIEHHLDTGDTHFGELQAWPSGGG